MKLILVTAAVLMTGASVYGIAESNRQSRSQEFKKLYNETTDEKPVMPAVKEEAKKPEVEKVLPAKEMEKKAPAPAKKKAVKKKKRLEPKFFSRAKLERG